MTAPDRFQLIVIGERISPGYKSAKALIDGGDIAGLKELAVKQAQAGASYIDVHLGMRGANDPAFVTEVIRGLQTAVSTPLSFDFAELKAQEACLRAYDKERAHGELPLVNSITEPHWDLMQLHALAPFKVIIMASERMQDGVPKSNKTGAEIAGTARRTALRLAGEYGMAMGDIFIDVSVRAIIADTTGMNRSVLDAVRLIRTDPDLKGIHIMGALTNIGQQMPPRAVDGSDLKQALENAFLTIAVPYGLDTVMGTPWRDYRPLPQDSHVLKTYREFLEQSGTNALRVVRKFYRA
jgi:5-methyltetrahydrofolate--homocysteine methyltransferase